MDHDQPAVYLLDPLPAQEALQGLYNQEPGRGQNCRALHFTSEYSDRGRETRSRGENYQIYVELNSEIVFLTFM